jgi:hypothetical protein
MKTNNNPIKRILRAFSPLLLAAFAMTTFAQPADDKSALLQIEREWNNALKTKDAA